jgi:hypothetical protein
MIQRLRSSSLMEQLPGIKTNGLQRVEWNRVAQELGQVWRLV